jgi:multiple sugar transport system ATP-binding protein
MAEIGLRNIHKSFGPLRLFEGISLVCPDRKYLCLLGPSGCGKTTLMRLVAGLTMPDAGDVLIGGQRVNDLPPAVRNVGLAFQNYALYPHLSVADNLAFPLRAPVRRRRYTKAGIEERVKRIAALLKIGAVLHRSVDQLSGGQQQRVALGRALIHDPQVLLLDEPVTHVDARLRYEMRAEIKLLHEHISTTTIHVTHDQQEALAMGDLIAVMREGRLEQLGRPLEVYNNPATAFVAGFVGDPPMSLVTAEVLAGDGGPALRIGGIMLPAPDALLPVLPSSSAEILVGIRPGQVRLVGDAVAGAIPATVHAHEMIGRELQLMLAVGDELVRYRTEERRTWSVGERVYVAPSLSAARLFDTITGRALVPIS